MPRGGPDDRHGSDRIRRAVLDDRRVLVQAGVKVLRLGGRQVAIASPGKRHVEFDLVDFYHNAATLHGVDTSGLA